MQFRDGMRKKGKFGDYVPVTMDELMARFVVSMEREACTRKFTDSTQLLLQPTLVHTDKLNLKKSVQNSATAL